MTARHPVLAVLTAMGLVAALLAGAAPSPAAPATVVTVAFSYAPPLVPTVEGEGLVLRNADIAPHDVVAVDHGDDGLPLFRSAIVGPGGSAPVEGAEVLPPGSYRFYCSLHPWMQGVLGVAGPAGAGPLPSAGTEAVPAGLPVATPTALAVADGWLYVASFTGGSVQRLPILEAGLLGPPETYATGFRNPLGVALDSAGWLYVADSHRSSRSNRSTAGRVWALPPGGGDAAAVGQVVVDELPNGRHNTNNLVVRDGRLWITNGNSTDDGVAGGEPEEPLSGTLLSVPLDARGIVVPAPPAEPDARLVVEATGLRNLYDVAFRPGTGEAWIPSNGPDTFDPYGEDLLHVVDDVAAEPPDFGFPGCLYGDLTPQVIQNPAVAGIDTCGNPPHTEPRALLGLHVSADGLAFGPPGEPWNGDLFIARFGNFFGDRVVGHDVLRLPVAADGTVGQATTFLAGVTPLDVAFGPPGTGLYVADFSTGQILLVRATA